jgi:hypothetical protein
MPQVFFPLPAPAGTQSGGNMFDDLRNAAASEPEVYDEVRPSLVERLPLFAQLKPQQRFILALLLFMNVTVLGCGCLLAFDRLIL